MSKSMAEEFEKLNLDGGIFVDFEDEVEEMEPGRDHWLTPGDQVTFPSVLNEETSSTVSVYDNYLNYLDGYLGDLANVSQLEVITPRCTCGSHSVDPHLPPERHSTWCDLQGERK